MDKKTQKVMPSKELKIKIGPNSYTIKLPNNGQLIDIEVRKMSLTSGMHKDLVFSGLASAVSAAAFVEAACTFTVLLPELLTDLNKPSLLDLDMLQSKDISKAYDQYYDWMASWRKFMNADDETEEKREEEEGGK